MILIFSMSLAACNMAPHGYQGAPVTRVSVNGSVFDVRQRGDKAVAIRVNSEWPSRREVAMPRAMLAIKMATQCRVIRADGDPSAPEARLDCGPDRHVVRQPVEYDCDVWEIDEGFIEVRCTEGI